MEKGELEYTLKEWFINNGKFLKISKIEKVLGMRTNSLYFFCKEGRKLSEQEMIVLHDWVTATFYDQKTGFQGKIKNNELILIKNKKENRDTTISAKDKLSLSDMLKQEGYEFNSESSDKSVSDIRKKKLGFQ